MPSFFMQHSGTSVNGVHSEFSEPQQPVLAERVLTSTVVMVPTTAAVSSSSTAASLTSPASGLDCTEPSESELCEIESLVKDLMGVATQCCFDTDIHPLVDTLATKYPKQVTEQELLEINPRYGDIFYRFISLRENYRRPVSDLLCDPLLPHMLDEDRNAVEVEAAVALATAPDNFCSTTTSQPTTTYHMTTPPCCTDPPTSISPHMDNSYNPYLSNASLPTSQVYDTNPLAPPPLHQPCSTTRVITTSPYAWLNRLSGIVTTDTTNNQLTIVPPFSSNLPHPTSTDAPAQTVNASSSPSSPSQPVAMVTTNKYLHGSNSKKLASLRKARPRSKRHPSELFRRNTSTLTSSSEDDQTDRHVTKSQSTVSPTNQLATPLSKTLSTSGNPFHLISVPFPLPTVLETSVIKTTPIATPVTTTTSLDTEDKTKDTTPTCRKKRFTQEDEIGLLRKRSKVEPGPHAGLKLWQYLLKILVEENNTSIVRWISKQEGTFRVVDSDGLAKLWGTHKNRQEMNYDKLSRAMRYYYHKNVLDKAPKRLCYQFRYYSYWWERLKEHDPTFVMATPPAPPTEPPPNLDNCE